MPRNQPKLHEAMRTILLGQPDQTASLLTLCEENARRDLYRQSLGSGEHPRPHQFKLRTLHYADLKFLPPDRVQYIGPIPK